MPAPVPNVLSSPFEYPLGTTPPATLAISCTPISGATYSWRLIERPPTSTAAITNATTATVTLSNFSTPGTYILFLVVTNDDGSSHPEPYPIQSVLPPYGFATPLQTAFALVRVADAAGLYKPGRGEYGWFEKGLWPLYDKVADGLEFAYYDEPTRTLTANAIEPDDTTGAVAVNVNGLNVTGTPSAVFLETTSASLVIMTGTTVTGVDLTVSGGVLRADQLSDASGGDLLITSNATLDLRGVNMRVEADEDISLNAVKTVEVNAEDVRIDTNVASIVVTNDIALVATDDITLNATDDIVLTADDITLTAADDITIATTGSNADILLVTQGTDGDISLYAADDILLTAAGPTGNIQLLASGASSTIAMTATNGVTLATTNDAATLSLTSGKDLSAVAAGAATFTGNSAAVTGTTALNLVTDDGNVIVSVGGDAVNETVDRGAQVTFSADNRRRIIDLDGYVSQRNHILTAGGATTTITPGATPTIVPLRGGVLPLYTTEALKGPSSDLDFALSFNASFIISGYTTIGATSFTLSLVLYDSTLFTATTLATFNFAPGGSLEVTERPCIVQGMLHSVGGKNVYCTGSAAMQLSDTTTVTLLSASLVNASSSLVNGSHGIFAFWASSNDTGASITNLTAAFSLLRGS